MGDVDTVSPPAVEPFAWLDGFEIDVAGAEPATVAPSAPAGSRFGPGSARAKIMENRASCSHSGTFESWLLALIGVGFAATCAACGLLCVRCGACGRRDAGADEYTRLR